MPNLQEIFDEIQTLKNERKEIQVEYKDALKNANEFEETDEKLKELKEKKKQIEAITQGRMGLRYQRFEEVKEKIKELDERLTDAAMTELMNGKTIEIKDQHENEYEPIYKISFKKRS